jgi:hypothetical protein
LGAIYLAATVIWLNWWHALNRDKHSLC